MSSDEVRLRLCYGYRSFQDCWDEAPPDAPLDGDGEEYGPVMVALPAAKHAALMRVVEAARSLGPLDPMRGNRRVLRVSLESICALRDALSAYRALNATAPERRGDSAKDGRKEAT